MTDRQFQKLKKRVQRIFTKFPNKVKRMIFDDEKNLYGEFVKNAGYNSELNIAYYVVLGKKIYIMTLNHDFTRSYAVTLYRKTIFGDVDIDIKIYDPKNDTPLFDNVLDLKSLVEFAKRGYPDKE